MSSVYEKLFDLSLFNAQQSVTVADGFHKRMKQIKELMANDHTAMIVTILDYMNRAGNVPLTFTAPNGNLTNLIENWKNNVNRGLNIDIPRGLRAFTEQYLRERWKSSLITVKLMWENVDGYELPTIMYVMDGSSVYITNNEGSLDTNRYFLGNPRGTSEFSPLSDNDSHSYIIRKPYTQSYDAYPDPYLVRRGAMKHALIKSLILSKQSEMVNTSFAYQLMLKVGSQDAIKRGAGPSEDELKNLLKQFQDRKKDSDEHGYAKGLAGAFPGDVNFEELIPDYKKIMDETIIKPTDKNILSALGMIELRGFSSNREEAILNPKIMVEEVMDGVADYVDFMEEVMAQIKERNSKKYTTKSKIEIEPGIVDTFMTNDMKTMIRNWFDRGLVSQEDALQATTQLNFRTQVIKRDQERKEELDLRMFPRVVQNMNNEETPNEDVPDDKKKNSPESKNFKNANEIKKIYKTIDELPEELKAQWTIAKQVKYIKDLNKE